MTRRLTDKEIRVRLDQPTYRALCERAKRSNTTMSTVMRRALVQSLAATVADATAPMIAAVLKGVAGRELREIKALARLAAYDAAVAKVLVRVHLEEYMDIDDKDNQAWVVEQVAEAKALALKRVQQAASQQPAAPLTRLPATDDARGLN